MFLYISIKTFKRKIMHAAVDIERTVFEIQILSESIC